jgi:hypothetical protein
VDPFNEKARIGFLKLPIQAFISDSAPKSARISMVAGAGFELDSSTFEVWVEVPLAA